MERCSDGGEDQGAEEALWGRRRQKAKNHYVSFGKIRLARAALSFSAIHSMILDLTPGTWKDARSLFFVFAPCSLLPLELRRLRPIAKRIERCSDAVEDQGVEERRDGRERSPCPTSSREACQAAASLGPPATPRCSLARWLSVWAIPSTCTPPFSAQRVRWVRCGLASCVAWLLSYS